MTKRTPAFVWACASVLGLGLTGCYHHHHEHEAVYVQEPGYVVAPTPPPAVIVEPRPYVAPAPDQIWIEGYWHWDRDRYTWHRGYWAAPPDRRSYWVAPRYERFEHGYRYTPGHWQRHEEHEEHEHDRR